MTVRRLLIRKTALVTEGSTETGRAILRALAAEGADLAFCCTPGDPEVIELAGKLRSFGGRVLPLERGSAHVSDSARLLDVVRGSLGSVDFAVLECPGATSPDDVSPGWLDAATPDQVLSDLSQFVEELRGSLRSEGASLSLLVSNCALRASPNRRLLAATHSGVLSLGRSFAVAFAPAVRVNCIALAPTHGATSVPGSTLSPPDSGTGSEDPRGRGGGPEDAAATVVFLASDLARFVTGETIVVDGGQSLQWRAGSL